MPYIDNKGELAKLRFGREFSIKMGEESFRNPWNKYSADLSDLVAREVGELRTKSFKPLVHKGQVILPLICNELALIPSLYTGAARLDSVFHVAENLFDSFSEREQRYLEFSQQLAQRDLVNPEFYIF